MSRSPGPTTSANVVEALRRQARDQLTPGACRDLTSGAVWIPDADPHRDAVNARQPAV